MRTAQYAFLPPEEYTFKVKVRNNDGVWNEEPAEFSFVTTSFLSAIEIKEKIIEDVKKFSKTTHQYDDIIVVAAKST